MEPEGTSGCTITPKNLTTLCTAFASNANGQRTPTQYPGGATVSVSYDNAGNATLVVAKNNGASTTLSSFQYCYKDLVSGACPSSSTVVDRANVTQAIKGPDSIVNPASTTDYTYDASGRLCRAMSTASSTCPSTPPASGNAYGYDGAGNRQWSVIGTTTSYYGYDADNRICWAKVTTSSPGTACSPAPSGSTTYAFDEAGDLNSSASPSSSFTYNTKAQSTAITDNGATLSSMSYADVGQSERVASTLSGSTTNYLNTPPGLDRSIPG